MSDTETLLDNNESQEKIPWYKKKVLGLPVLAWILIILAVVAAIVAAVIYIIKKKKSSTVAITGKSEQKDSYEPLNVVETYKKDKEGVTKNSFVTSYIDSTLGSFEA